MPTLPIAVRQATQTNRVFGAGARNPESGIQGNPGTPYLFLFSFRREIRGELELLKIDMVSLDSLEIAAPF
jgi:hypothetical protein